jgi:hypothetical protein
VPVDDSDSAKVAMYALVKDCLDTLDMETDPYSSRRAYSALQVVPELKFGCSYSHLR